MKKILILGAGRGQVELIKAAKKYGYSPVVASIPGNYPGFQYADETVNVDIRSKEQVLAVAKKLHVDGIATACMDTGIEALGYVCDKMGLIGLSEQAATCSGNKYDMKRAFDEYNVCSAKYIKVMEERELETAIQTIGFPMVVKAVDLQGSKGINIVLKEEELYPAYCETMSETHEDYCLIEEYIAGKEFGAEAFIYNGEILYILPCGKINSRGNTNIPVGHDVPMELSKEQIEAVNEQVQKAIHATGLDNCAVNLDLIERNGQIYVIELSGRIGANGLTQLVSVYYGIDVFRLIVETAMGVDPRLYFKEYCQTPTCCYSRMLTSDRTGRLLRITNNNQQREDIIEISFYLVEGDEVRRFSNSRDCIGEVIVKGKTRHQCEQLLEQVIANIHTEVE